jgi:hypothetical protein
MRRTMEKTVDRLSKYMWSKRKRVVDEVLGGLISTPEPLWPYLLLTHTEDRPPFENDMQLCGARHE